jgi:hypothetical protein|tara:strand:+ start:151 stop:549 length:399 start_codon:yes stop_codon:yes gene_type:complete
MVTGIGQAPWENVAIVTSQLSRPASYYARIKYCLQWTYRQRLEGYVVDKVMSKRYTKQTLNSVKGKNIRPVDVQGLVRLAMLESVLEKQLSKEVQAFVVDVSWSRLRALKTMYKREVLPIFQEFETEIWTVR